MSLAIVMVHVEVIEQAVMPLAVVLNVTPVIAIAPALALAFGFGVAPKYLLTAIITFFPLLVNALVGLRSIDRRALDIARTLNASRWEILWHLRLPSSLPYLFAGARVCLPLAVVGAVVAEFVVAGTQGGLGSVISIALNYSELASVYAAIGCLAIMGVVLTGVVVVLERRMLAHTSHRSQYK
jgi:NitT/TauT family transport system permease protein